VRVTRGNGDLTRSDAGLPGPLTSAGATGVSAETRARAVRGAAGVQRGRFRGNAGQDRVAGPQVSGGGVSAETRARAGRREQPVSGGGVSAETRAKAA
jgi:hypothetical protein